MRGRQIGATCSDDEKGHDRKGEIILKKMISLLDTAVKNQKKHRDVSKLQTNYESLTPEILNHLKIIMVLV